MYTCKILEKHGSNPSHYTVECINDLGAKKYYAFSMNDDNSAIQYAENILSVNDDIENLITDDMLNNLTISESFNMEELLEPPLNISASYLQANPSASVSPQITITQPQIQIIHSTNCASSKITGTSLFKVGGGGFFLQNGLWNVTPGLYIHVVQGKINGDNHCEIRSQVYYN
ncbi:hypothetical protein K0U91_08025 [Chryseobacterium chendengshani]|uniref:hypothetical protein n=1 Tax=Chryseobacterium sp. LJ668 TaxID=2864040 RepID=UPI001C689719|nr:hypothetical protein [Chryseobacterium sp. LJ668]MBW8522419.1 hypothetical protein [Chryseobacterium sp. LJ668]QYK18058.1 hypothetical protein K0U91_08025 [Chryseobacterium sp. LJ668]